MRTSAASLGGRDISGTRTPAGVAAYCTDNMMCDLMNAPFVDDAYNAIVWYQKRCRREGEHTCAFLRMVVAWPPN